MIENKRKYILDIFSTKIIFSVIMDNEIFFFVVAGVRTQTLHILYIVSTN